MLAAGFCSGAWLLHAELTGANLLGLPPIFPGVVASLVIYLLGAHDRPTRPDRRVEKA
jgi:hypothetical protein